MKLNFKKFVSRKTKGFSGITHLLIAILLLFLLLYIPIPFTSVYKNIFFQKWQYIVVLFFVLTGAALLPDLDSNRSTAFFQLGIFGRLMRTMMKSTSYLVTTLTRMRDDWIPESQHRCLWHTPFVAFLIGFSLWYFIEPVDIVYFSLWQNAVETGTVLNVLLKYIPVHICMFLALCSIYISVGMITFRLFKPLPMNLKRLLPIIIVGIVFVLLFMFTVNELRYVGISIGMGYLFHIIGDVFSQGSIPVIWPIPVITKRKKMMWWRPRFLIFGKIETGSIYNTIIDFVVLALDLFLFYAIFIHDKIRT